MSAAVLPPSEQSIIDMPSRTNRKFNSSRCYFHNGSYTATSMASRRRYSRRYWEHHVRAQFQFVSIRDMAYPCPETLQNYLRSSPENAAKPKWIIKPSSVCGRGLFATERIEKETLIFINKPLIVGLRADYVGNDYCTICFKISDFCFECDKCSILICSEQCKTSEEHSKECAFIIENWKPKENNESTNSSLLARSLIYLRFLLLSEEKIKIVSYLQKNGNHSNGNAQELETLFSKYAIPEEQILFMKTMSSVLKINSFRIPNNSREKIIPLRGLYALSALLNHNCVPNTRNTFTTDYSMAVYASKDIEIGEEIFTSYTGLLWCSPARRVQLYTTKQFWCKCNRCKDGTEMGTRLSALKCQDKECVGVLLPVTPLDPRTEWSCDICGAVESPARVCTLQSVLGSLVGTLDLDDQMRLETSILQRLANFIPYSSHIFVDLRLRLALKIGFAEGLKLSGIIYSNAATEITALSI